MEVDENGLKRPLLLNKVAGFYDIQSSQFFFYCTNGKGETNLTSLAAS